VRALGGSTRPVKGALSMAMSAAHVGESLRSKIRRAEDSHSRLGETRPRVRGIIVPSANAAEAAVLEDLDVIAVDSLAQTVAFLTGELDIEPTPSRLDELFQELSHYEEDFADVRGQEMAKRAVTIAPAGSHNLLMLWPFTPSPKPFDFRMLSIVLRSRRRGFGELVIAEEGRNTAVRKNFGLNT
jgi:magnesium chelatase family protein